MTTHQQATDYLFGLIDYEKTPAQIAMQRYLNLDRMREALERVGNPHAGLTFAHIAGTKGKGSTAAMLASILQSSGVRTGLYTSPHLVSFHERIQVNGEMVPEENLTRLLEQIRPVVTAMESGPHGAPTFFETTTLLALLYFAERQVDVTVLETGMGGRLDATNVVSPRVTAITTIALDHTLELGNTLAGIAGEKAGIIKPGVPVISAPQDAEAARVIRETADRQGSPLYRVGEDIVLDEGADAFTVHGRRETYPGVRCPLLGVHQHTNAAMAVGMAECLADAGLPITAETIRAGIASVRWPGRLQVLREQPWLILDGAHDPAATVILLAALDRHFPAKRRHYVLGFSREKEWQEMLHLLAPTAASFVLTAAKNPRAVAPDLLANEAGVFSVPVYAKPDLPAALSTALQQADTDDLICVTGSLFVVGDALKYWFAPSRQLV